MGLNANAIQIKIEINTSFASILGLSQYTSGNYTGLYYTNLGEYPQSLYGPTQPDNTVLNTTSSYYENSETGEKYKFKNSNYYRVEPIKWVIIGGDALGLPNSDSLAENQLLMISEKCIETSIFHTPTSSSSYTAWTNSTLYSFLLATQNIVFSESEAEKLSNIDGHKLSLLSYGATYSFNYSNYNVPATLLKSTATGFCGSVGYTEWYLRMTTVNGSTCKSAAFGISLSSGTIQTNTQSNEHLMTQIRYIRPIIVLNV
ncbi:MAG: hypothetical protein PHR96_02930 [Clostridia bacterium]|nr:hypothetical protein [Clostridia bacterium]